MGMTLPCNPSLTFSRSFPICEKVTRREPLGKRLAGANAFAASPGPAAAGSAPCAHFSRGVRMRASLSRHSVRQYSEGLGPGIPEAVGLQLLESLDSTQIDRVLKE